MCGTARLGSMKTFLATAMQHQNDRELKTALALKGLFDSKYGADSTFLAAEQFPTPATYLPPVEGYHFVVDRLRKSDLMVLYYPERVVSGALVELGLALGLHIPVIAFTKCSANLPYMVRQSLPGYAVIVGIGADSSSPESDAKWMFTMLEAKYGEW